MEKEVGTNNLFKNSTIECMKKIIKIEALPFTYNKVGSSNKHEQWVHIFYSDGSYTTASVVMPVNVSLFTS